MEKSFRLGPVVGLCVGLAIVGCNGPDRGDDKAASETTETRSSALTTSLFQPYVAYPTGSFPEAVAIGDLDGDGRNDVALLTSSYFDPANDYMVHVFLQDTTGAFKPRVKYSVGKQGHSIDIGDVNGDGRADVVVGLSSGSGTGVGVLLQNASGTLNPMQTYATVHSYMVKVGDFNGDGRMDVAGINYGVYDDGLDVFLQTASGTLASPVLYHVPHGGSDELDAGDIDGDGRTDIVVMDGQSTTRNVSVVLQTPDGLLGAPVGYAVGGGNRTTGVALGDTNGDGRSDIVVSYGGNLPSSRIARFLQNAAGTMDPAVSYPSFQTPSAMVVADMDGDGRKDALVTHDGYARLGVYRQFPSGDFVAEELYTIPSASSYQRQGLAVGDINGDGRPDAVIADYLHGLIVLRHVAETALGLAIAAPADGGTYYTGVPLTVRWTTGDTIALSSFDVSISYFDGFTYGPYTPLAGCTGLPSTATQCPWTPTTPTLRPARLRVTARDTAGQTAFAESNITLISPSIGPSVPSSSLTIGTTATISWLHNLPPGGTVRIELSRDNGPYETLADSVPINVPGGTTAGNYAWTVTGPLAAKGRLRVTSNDSLPIPVVGTTSNFAIVGTPTMTVTAPAAGATVYATALSVSWTTNVSNTATVLIELSRDGGSTFETLAAAAPNSGSFNASVSGPDAASAVVRVTTNGSVVATGTSAPFTLAQPTLTVTSPAAGSLLYAGTPQLVAWSSNLPATSTVNIELSRDGGATYEVLVPNALNTGSFAFLAAGPSTAAALVRLTLASPVSISATSGTFAIIDPSLTVTGPAAGAALYAGTTAAITWSTNLPAASVGIELSRDGGSTFETVAAAPNTGSFAWVVNGPDAVAAVVRVTATDPVAASGTSGAFSITTPSLTVTGPAAGTLAYAGTPVTITWTHNLPDVDPVSIELSRDDGATFVLLDAAAANTGSFVWAASGPDTTAARVRVTSSGAVSASNVGPAFQIITGTMAVTSPAAGENWVIGTSHTVSWSSNLPAGTTALVELSRDNGSTWTTLSSAASGGSLAWTATAPATGTALVRVTANGGVSASATSGAFIIGNPSVTVTSPASAAKWTIGTAQTIAWTTNLPSTATVKIELSRNGGSTYTTLGSAAPNSGSFAWTATGATSTTAKVRVSVNGFSASSVSGTFSLVAASITVTSPNTAVTWTVGTVHAITWNHNLGASAQFKIEVSRGGVWSTITPAVSGGGATTGSYQWTVAAPKTGTARIRVTWTGNTSVTDSSDVSFRIN